MYPYPFGPMSLQLILLIIYHLPFGHSPPPCLALGGQNSERTGSAQILCTGRLHGILGPGVVWGCHRGARDPTKGALVHHLGTIFGDFGRQLGSILDHFGVKIWRFGGLGASGGASGSHVGPHGRPEGPKWPKQDEKAHPWDPLLGTIFGPKSTKSGQRAPESVKGGLRGPSRRSLRFWPLFGTGPGRGHVLQIQHWLYPNHISASAKKSLFGFLLASVLEPLGHPWGSCWALWGPKVGHKGQKWRSKNRPKKRSEKSHATVRKGLRAGTCSTLKIVQSDSQGIPKHPMTTPLVPCRHGGGWDLWGK